MPDYLGNDQRKTKDKGSGDKEDEKSKEFEGKFFCYLCTTFQ